MATESIGHAPETESKVKPKFSKDPVNTLPEYGIGYYLIDHKKIGLMYGLTALFFLIIGGVEALLIRSQLWDHNMTVPH